jgi:hypothetical protein
MDLIPPVSIKEMDYGRLFEAMIEGYITGSELVEDGFFKAEVFNRNGSPSECPKEVVEALANGDDLNALYVRKKDGDLSGTYHTRHQWLDIYIQSAGKTIIPAQVWEQVGRCVESAMLIKPLDYLGQSITLAELLPSGSFQYPRQWTGADGIEKKGLLDWYTDQTRPGIVLDFKLTTNFGSFIRRLRQEKWVQQPHYLEGLDAIFIFIVASVEPPCQAGALVLEGNGIYEKYCQECVNYDAWNRAGRIAKGYRDIEVVNLYF